jgi:peptidoglycan/LPS O-acetylase OafA/YrhL
MTRRAPVRSLGWCAGITATAVAAYGAFLAWDQHKDRDPVTGVETGPYEPWQVAGFGLVLAAVAFAAGWFGRAWIAVALIPLSLAACFALDAATDNGAGGLWLVGAVLVAVGALVATAAVTALGALLRRAISRP